jgi:hypothetical protein
MGDYEINKIEHGFEMPDEMRNLPDFNLVIPSEIEGVPVTRLKGGDYDFGVLQSSSHAAWQA